MTVSPGESIQAVVNANPAGTTYVIKSGVHRLQDVTPKDGDTFVGEQGSILSGAAVMTGFGREGSYWVATESRRSTAEHRGVCEDGYSACQLPEQLFMDGQPLWRADSLSEVSAGSWYFDYSSDKVYMADDPAGHTIEISIAEYAFSGTATDVTIRGLIIDKYANGPQTGAVNGGVGRTGSEADGWVVVDNEIRHSHGEGVKLSGHMLLANNYIHHNGRLGVGGGTAENSIVENNEIAYNCESGGYACWGWGGGGAKFAASINLVVRGNYVHHNRGPGLHTDVGAVNALFEDNHVVDNDGGGISIEISYGAIVRDNFIQNNGHNSPNGPGAGIIVISSNDVTVSTNIVTDCGNGIVGRQVERDPGRQGPHELDNLSVRDNIITMNDGFSGLVQRVNDSSYFRTRNNVFQSNTYHLGSESEYFRWEGESVTATEWVAFGNDTMGTFT
ncbi:MAG: right-handed parallel beta-helix repeat-containing protein [Acidimicrobiales bacterium]